MKILTNPLSIIIAILMVSLIGAIIVNIPSDKELLTQEYQFLVAESLEVFEKKKLLQNSQITIDLYSNVSIGVSITFQRFTFKSSNSTIFTIFEGVIKNNYSEDLTSDTSGILNLAIQFHSSNGSNTQSLANEMGKVKLLIHNTTDFNQYFTPHISFFLVVTFLFFFVEILKQKNYLVSEESKLLTSERNSLSFTNQFVSGFNQVQRLSIYNHISHFMTRHNFTKFFVIIGLVNALGTSFGVMPENPNLNSTDYQFLIQDNIAFLSLTLNVSLVVYFFKIDESQIYDWTYPRVRSFLISINYIFVISLILVSNFVYRVTLSIIRYHLILNTSFHFVKLIELIFYLFLIDVLQIGLISVLYFLTKNIHQTLSIIFSVFFIFNIIIIQQSDIVFPYYSRMLNLLTMKLILRLQFVLISMLIVGLVFSFAVRLYMKLDLR